MVSTVVGKLVEHQCCWKILLLALTAAECCRRKALLINILLLELLSLVSTAT